MVLKETTWENPVGTLTLDRAYRVGILEPLLDPHSSRIHPLQISP